MTNKLRAVPKAPEARTAATQTELWYLECFRILAKHYKRSPSIHELAHYCQRSHTPVGAALQSLWRKGHLARESTGGMKAKYAIREAS